MSIIFIELSFRLALGRAHTHEPTLSRIRAPVDSETAIVVNGSKAREREVSDAKGNSSTKASVVITRPSCLIDSPSIIQSRKQSQRPLKKDDFYFKILSWTVKKPKGQKEEQKQRIPVPKQASFLAILLANLSLIYDSKTIYTSRSISAASIGQGLKSSYAESLSLSLIQFESSVI